MTCACGLPGDGDGAPCVHAPTLARVLGARPANTVAWRVAPGQRACTHAPDVSIAEYLGVQRVVEPQDALALYTCRACGTTFGVAVQAQLHDSGGLR